MRGVEARLVAAELRPARGRVALWVLASGVAAVLLCLAAVREHRLRGDAVPAARDMPRGFSPVVPPMMAPATSEDAAVKPFARRLPVPSPDKPAGAAVQPVTAALVSFPAPEAALTEQERLLLQLVHRKDPVEVAMLDPRELAREEAVEAAEFQRFFPPPPPPDNVVPDDPTKEKGDSK
jgi:hypothetical protein